MIIIVYEIPLKYWPRFVLYYHMADGNNPPFLEIGKFTNIIIIKVFKIIQKIQWGVIRTHLQLMWIIFGRNRKYILEHFLLDLYLEFMFVARKVTIDFQVFLTYPNIGNVGLKCWLEQMLNDFFNFYLLKVMKNVQGKKIETEWSQHVELQRTFEHSWNLEKFTFSLYFNFST